MGNSLGWKKTAKVMKINGETLKLKTPVRAEEVVKEYPGHVLLESEAVKHFGTRAKPLQPQQNLEPKRLYFLVELPEVPKERLPRRVRSGIHMSAKDRLESLMLARRSASDLTSLRAGRAVSGEISEEGGPMRVTMRLPKAEVERLMKESRNEAETAENIMNLYMANGGGAPQVPHWNGGQGRVHGGLKATSTKRVSFLPINEGGNQIAVAF